MPNEQRPAETTAQQSDAAEVATSTPTCSKTPVGGSAFIRTYSKYCPNCGTTAKFDTEKYCSDRCKFEYKSKLEKRFG